MRKRSLIYFALLIASVVWVSFQGGTMPYLCFFTILLYLPVTLLFTFLTWQSLHIWQELPSHHLKKGEETEFYLVLENAFIFSMPEISLNRNDTLCSFSGEQNTVRLKGREKYEEHSKVKCLYAGSYPVGVKTYSFTDLFSFFRFTFPVKTEFRCFVRPRITGDADRFLNELTGEENRILQSPAAVEGIGTDLKRYENGDKWSRIHWKAYARTGELLVRQEEPVDMEERTIILYPEKNEDTMEFIVRRDRFLEYVISAVYYFCSRDRGVLVLYPHGHWEKHPLSSLEDFGIFYRELSEKLRMEEEEAPPAKGAVIGLREADF